METAIVTKTSKIFPTTYGKGMFFRVQFKGKSVSCVTYNSQLANSIVENATIEFDWWEPKNVKNPDESWKVVMMISNATVTLDNGAVIETPENEAGEQKLKEVEASEELEFDWDKELL